MNRGLKPNRTGQPTNEVLGYKPRPDE